MRNPANDGGALRYSQEQDRENPREPSGPHQGKEERAEACGGDESLDACLHHQQQNEPRKHHCRKSSGRVQCAPNADFIGKGPAERLGLPPTRKPFEPRDVPRGRRDVLKDAIEAKLAGNFAVIVAAQILKL